MDLHRRTRREGQRLTDVDVDLEWRASGSGSVCREILGELPTWFGIDDAVTDYVQAADTTPTLLAAVDGIVLGLLVPVVHTAYAAEIHLIAVRPASHRRGIGRRMVAALEEHLAGRGIEYLQVKTLSEQHPDEGYARTRAFYLACDFRPLEEFPTLWDPSNPALQMVKRIG